MKASLSIVAAAASLLPVAVADLDPIVIKGSKFFYKSNGTQFYMNGVAYQQEPANTTASAKYVDPLADEKICQRDIPYLKQLKTNTIRVYAIDPTKDHDPCMKLLQDAGIYVVSDLSEPDLSINRDFPEWDDDLYTRYTAVIDALAPYSNVLGFFAGNEVSNNVSNTNASPFVKAAARDMKAYIKQKKYRNIPVGYATNDDSDIRLNLAHYFNCNSEDEAIDFWGYNIYSWCGDSSYTKSGYDVRTKEYSDYSKPVFFAEYGCNEGGKTREFTEIATLYGKQMTIVWSGGIVYMYYQEANNYGLVKVNGNTVTKLDDFDHLKNQLSKANPIRVQEDSYTPTNTKLSDCPAVDSTWKASAVLPPTPDKSLCSCMVKSLNCVAKDNIKDKTVDELFSFICGGDTECSGITANGTTGKYGAYSMCNSMERLSWAMNAYYESKDSSDYACDFEGSATKQTPSNDAKCSAAIKEVGGMAGTRPKVSGNGTSSDNDRSSATNLHASLTIVTSKIGVAIFVAVLGGVFMAI